MLPVVGDRAVVIMAGGSGERFWPVSRRLRPKQLLPLSRPDKSMLAEAVERAEDLVGIDRVFVITAGHLLGPVASACPQLHAGNVLADPVKRNTGGALSWAAAELMARFGDDAESICMAVLTADQRVDPPERFAACIDAAMRCAETTQSLVTVGIPPARPETGFGYVEADLGQSLHVDGVHAWSVRRFHEKPSQELAERYAQTPGFYWNSGMFFWTIGTFLREMRVASSQHASSIELMAQMLAAGNRSEAEAVFAELPDISIDYLLMEKSSSVSVVEATFDWDDLGSWDAVGRYREQDERGNAVIGESVLIHSADCVVYNESSGITVAVSGGYNLLVVVTDDAVLVCDKDQAQSVKEIVAHLKAKGIDKL